MVFGIFGGKEERVGGVDEFLEINELVGEKKKKIDIRIENLNDYRGVEKVQKLMREGNIVLLRIKKLRERDLGELKRCVERLRRTSMAMNGEIMGVQEDFLILTPPFAKIWKGEVEEIMKEG